MTEERQRIAIAEACGWTRVEYPWGYLPNGSSPYEGTKIPNYPADLNAMHEAVLTLDRRTLDYSNYCSHLQQIVAVENSKSDKPGTQAIDATAAQRAEAFLKVIGRWEDGQ